MDWQYPTRRELSGGILSRNGGEGICHSANHRRNGLEMARLFTSGAETKSQGTEGVGVGSLSVTFDTTTLRSGAVSFKCDSGAANESSRISFNIASSLGVWYFARDFFLFGTSLP